MPDNAKKNWFLHQAANLQVRLRAYIRSLGVRSQEVDDFAQEALALTWKKVDEFQTGKDLGPWVFGIARKLIMAARRTEARRRRILSDHVTDLLLKFVEPPLLEKLVSAEFLAAIRNCKEKLSADEQELVRQRYEEDIKPGEIAAMLNKSSGSIRIRLLRLRDQLRTCIEQRHGLLSSLPEHESR